MIEQASNAEAKPKVRRRWRLAWLVVLMAVLAPLALLLRPQSPFERYVSPPLDAKGVVPRKVSGIRGTFGTVRRPDGRRQVTFNGLAIYTYAHEGPGQVLCNNVNGWFVVRVR